MKREAQTQAAPAHCALCGAALQRGAVHVCSHRGLDPLKFAELFWEEV